MTSREQFEAEYSKMMGTPIGVLKVLRAGDVYSETEGDRLSIAWWAWQASREAVEVDLPDKQFISEEDVLIPDEVDWPDGFNTALEQCAEAIRAAGIKVAGE